MKVQAQRKFAQGVPLPPSTSAPFTVQIEKKNDTATEHQEQCFMPPKTSAKKLLDYVAFKGVHVHSPVILVKRLDNEQAAEVEDEQMENDTSSVSSSSLASTYKHVSLSLRHAYNIPITKKMSLLRKVTNLHPLRLRSRTISNIEIKKKIPKKKPFKRYPQKVTRNKNKTNQVKKAETKSRLSKQKSIDSGFSVDDEKPLTFLKHRLKTRNAELQKLSSNNDKGNTGDQPEASNKRTGNSDISSDALKRVATDEVDSENNESRGESSSHDQKRQRSPTKVLYIVKSTKCELEADKLNHNHRLKRNVKSVKIIKTSEAVARRNSPNTIPGINLHLSHQPLPKPQIAKKTACSRDYAVAGPSSAPDQVLDESDEVINIHSTGSAKKIKKGKSTVKKINKQGSDTDKKVLDEHIQEKNASKKTNTSPPKTSEGPKIIEAKIFHPSVEEFKDPVAYFEKIMPVAAKYGICKVVAPQDFKPSCTVTETIRFKVYNQYIGRLCNRWGSMIREYCAIRSYLSSVDVQFNRMPAVEGVEINFSKLLSYVRKQNGLHTTFKKRLANKDSKRWVALFQELNYTTFEGLEKKFDQIYLNYVAPFYSLPHCTRQKYLERMDIKWEKRNVQLLKRAQNPLHRQKKLLEESESSDDYDSDETQCEELVLDYAEDCINQGKIMNIAAFMKVAENAVTIFDTKNLSTEAIEARYWRTVLLGDDHMCVYSGAVDTGDEGYGFTIKRDEPFGDHPWNLKMFCENKGNILRSLGRIMGLTVPTLHLGMVFTTSCWHRDPHGLPWIEYMHSGPEKIWYGIPDSESAKFRQAMEIICPTACQNKSIWLPSDVAMIPPNLLLERGVSLSKVTQKPGEYIIVFPKAYSCSVCTGFTISESTYFASNSWLKSVINVFQELRTNCEPSMFALEQLLMQVARDPTASLSMLQLVYKSFSNILTEELENRRRLELHGLTPTEPQLADRDNPSGRWNVIDKECEICRSTLCLSRVKGIFHKHLSVCLRHAVQVIESKTNNAGRREKASYHLQYIFSNSELENMMEAVIDRLTKTT